MEKSFAVGPPLDRALSSYTIEEKVKIIIDFFKSGVLVELSMIIWNDSLKKTILDQNEKELTAAHHNPDYKIQLENLFISIDNYKYIASSDLRILKPWFASFNKLRYNENLIKDVNQTQDVYHLDLYYHLNLSYALKYPDVLSYKFKAPEDDAELFCRIQILKNKPEFQPWMNLWFQPPYLEKVNSMTEYDERWPELKQRAYLVCRLDYYAGVLERFVNKYPVIPEQLAERFKFYYEHVILQAACSRKLINFIIYRNVTRGHPATPT